MTEEKSDNLPVLAGDREVVSSDDLQSWLDALEKAGAGSYAKVAEQAYYQEVVEPLAEVERDLQELAVQQIDDPYGKLEQLDFSAFQKAVLDFLKENSEELDAVIEQIPSEQRTLEVIFRRFFGDKKRVFAFLDAIPFDVAEYKGDKFYREFAAKILRDFCSLNGLSYTGGALLNVYENTRMSGNQWVEFHSDGDGEIHSLHVSSGFTGDSLCRVLSFPFKVSKDEVTKHVEFNQNSTGFYDSTVLEALKQTGLLSERSAKNIANSTDDFFALLYHRKAESSLTQQKNKLERDQLSHWAVKPVVPEIFKPEDGEVKFPYVRHQFDLCAWRKFLDEGSDGLISWLAEFDDVKWAENYGEEIDDLAFSRGKLARWLTSATPRKRIAALESEGSEPHAQDLYDSYLRVDKFMESGKILIDEASKSQGGFSENLKAQGFRLLFLAHGISCVLSNEVVLLNARLRARAEIGTIINMPQLMALGRALAGVAEDPMSNEVDRFMRELPMVVDAVMEVEG